MPAENHRSIQNKDRSFCKLEMTSAHTESLLQNVVPLRKKNLGVPRKVPDHKDVEHAAQTAPLNPHAPASEVQRRAPAEALSCRGRMRTCSPQEWTIEVRMPQGLEHSGLIGFLSPESTFSARVVSINTHQHFCQNVVDSNVVCNQIKRSDNVNGAFSFDMKSVLQSNIYEISIRDPEWSRTLNKPTRNKIRSGSLQLSGHHVDCHVTYTHQQNASSASDLSATNTPSNPRHKQTE